MTTTLTGDTGGRWVVRTKTSAYHLDLDAKTAVRSPEGDVDGFSAAALRRDEQAWQIASLMTCAVGYPMELMALGIADDPEVMTYRCTTPVVSISPAP